jgi:hypothetical protein
MQRNRMKGRKTQMNEQGKKGGRDSKRNKYIVEGKIKRKGDKTIRKQAEKESEGKRN